LVLKTRNKGFPDITFGGLQACFPVWRWSRREYSQHKRCARGLLRGDVGCNDLAIAF
jgi:hypothetical protein